METFPRDQQLIILLIIFGMTLLYFHSINIPSRQPSAISGQRFSDSLNQPATSHQSLTSQPSADKKLSGAKLLTLNKPINLNTAAIGDLEAITGIGPKTAEKIIDYRNKHGRFEKIEDIKNIKGIKEKRFEKIKKYLTVG